MIDPSRNAPCPCGSGRRYKDCHGALAAAPAAEASALAEAHFHRGNAARERGDADAAVTAYEASLKVLPEHPAVLNNLGLAQDALGRPAEAEACYRRALAGDPRNADALGNLANILFARREYAATEEIYERLFALRPDPPAYVWLQRGHGLRVRSRFAAAEQCFRAALAAEPGALPTLVKLSAVLLDLERYAEVLPLCEQILGREPDHAQARMTICAAKQHLCLWSGLAEDLRQLRAYLDRHPEGGPWPQNPFALLAAPLGRSCQAAAARGLARPLLVPGATPPAPRELPPGARLKIGFVSSDFRAHAMTFLCLEHWERLRGGRLETFAYSLHPDAPGALGERLRSAFDHYVNVADDAAEAIAERIRADGIDMLLDCNGYTRHSRPEIFARRPAPIQVNYLGFPGTLGAPWYDYILVDGFGLPPEHEAWYDEKPMRMPHSSYPSDTQRVPPGPPPGRAAHGLPDDAFVFCCFNASNKILPDVFAVWMRLLAAVDGSVLWLLAHNVPVRHNLQREAVAAGIAPQRLLFAQRVTPAEHLARQPLADLFLDTLPYGAHTTANDALLMGLPVLTCAGDRLAARIAGSQLHAIGLPELVTDSLAGYEALALALAHDPARLGALRARLAANRTTHPLFDMRRYSADFEDLVLATWADYRATAR